jgi:hypothetical protein
MKNMVVDGSFLQVMAGRVWEGWGGASASSQPMVGSFCIVQSQPIIQPMFSSAFADEEK